MIETLKPESRAHLRHEFRTPVNHIIGYSELLMEDAGERRLEPFVPVFQRIHKSGRELLESIQSNFSDQGEPGNDSEGAEFRANLHASAVEVSASLRTLIEKLKIDHRQTLADLDAISWAILRLLELAGEDGHIPGAACVAPARRTDHSPHEFPSVPAKRGGGKILIADDDASNRNLLRRRLECEGHHTVEVANGLEVLESLKNSPCDLVLLDIMMPAMDGFETLAKMKQDPALRELPVIMISALDEMQSVVRCIEMGADDYLSKPFNRVLLRARIAASLEKKWLRDREHRKTDELEQTLRLLERAQEQLAVQASRDALTGLANRRSIESHLDVRVKRGQSFTAIYIDLNGFKRINDSHGHAVGDDLLKQVAHRLQTAFRSTDVVGRWGGDEFVALADVGFTDAQVITSRIRDCLTADFVISKEQAEHRITIGAALGVAIWKPGDTAAEVLHRADFAMYEEKLRRNE
jgi:diguanylate cyclase (GGDEF)-like protein